MQYKNTEKTIKQIAEELGVVHVLEGSVRRFQHEIRITVQLIDAPTDQHIWSETYDRELVDVFEIQSDVAQRVALALNAKLEPEVIERIEQPPTSNIQAYDLFLKAKEGMLFQTVEYKNIQWLDQAIQLDSTFAAAYAMKGLSLLFQAGHLYGLSPSQVEKEARESLEKALLMDPLQGLAHYSMGAYHLWYEKDFNKSEIEFLTAKKLLPSDPLMDLIYLNFLHASSRHEEGLAVGESLIVNESGISGFWGWMALSYAFNNKAEELKKAIEMVRREPPENLAPYIEGARALLIQKQYEEIIALLQTSPGTITTSRGMSMLSIAYYKAGQMELHDQYLKDLIHRSEKTAGGSPSFYTAMVYASKHETELAFQWLDKSFQDNEIELYWLKVEPEFASLYDDPRWPQLLDGRGYP